MSVEKALDVYRDHDSIEKLFRTLKTELDYAKFEEHKKRKSQRFHRTIRIVRISKYRMHQKSKWKIYEKICFNSKTKKDIETI